MLEEMIIRHGSPTLAGLKTANLINCTYESEQDMHASIRCLNRQLVPKGLRLIPMKFSEKRVLIYVFRPDKLKADLADCSACRMLQERGYCTGNVSACLAQLRKKLHADEEFPHEIGLFLGYPPEDVSGFIENREEDFKFSGIWKVYGNEERARELFESFRNCNKDYYSMWSQGISVEDLAVAA